MRTIADLDVLVRSIGRLCDDPECVHCATADIFAVEVHEFTPGVSGYNNHGCRCGYCRGRWANYIRERRSTLGRPLRRR